MNNPNSQDINNDPIKEPTENGQNFEHPQLAEQPSAEQLQEPSQTLPHYGRLRLSKSETKKLNDIVSVLLSADDPQKACAELDNTLTGNARRPLEVAKRILSGDITNMQAEGMFAILDKLAKQGEQPVMSYIDQYAILDIESNRIAKFVKQNWGGVLYFVLMSIVYFIVMTIYRVKVLPVFAELYESMGAELPAFTQLVMVDNGLEVMILLVFIVAVLFGGLLPFMFRRALASLEPLPKYLLIFPTYIFTDYLYHRYLLLVYARIYVQVGESNPIEKAQQALKVGRLPKDDWDLLNVASNHYAKESLERQLQKREDQLLQQLKARIEITQTTINIIIFILFAYVLMAPVLAMYLPIFQMGAIVS